jgi:hypothetical protein
MIRRSTWIVLGVAVALVLSYWLWQRYQANQEPEAQEATPTTAPVVSLFDLSNLFVTGMTFSGADGKMVVVLRDTATGQWTMPDVPAESVDTFRIGTLAGQLFAMRVERTLETTQSPAALGLDTPTYTIQLTLEDGRQQVLLVGDATPIGTGYYVQLDGNAPVIVAKVDLDPVLGIVDNPPLLPTPSPTVTETPLQLETTPTDAETATPEPPAVTPSPTPSG